MTEDIVARVITQGIPEALIPAFNLLYNDGMDPEAAADLVTVVHLDGGDPLVMANHMLVLRKAFRGEDAE